MIWVGINWSWRGSTYNLPTRRFSNERLMVCFANSTFTYCLTWTHINPVHTIWICFSLGLRICFPINQCSSYNLNLLLSWRLDYAIVDNHASPRSPDLWAFDCKWIVKETLSKGWRKTCEHFDCKLNSKETLSRVRRGREPDHLVERESLLEPIFRHLLQPPPSLVGPIFLLVEKCLGFAKRTIVWKSKYLPKNSFAEVPTPTWTSVGERLYLDSIPWWLMEFICRVALALLIALVMWVCV